MASDLGILDFRKKGFGSKGFDCTYLTPFCEAFELIIQSPMSDVASDWLAGSPMIPVGTSHNDDPSLLLLFQHLKSKSLQTAKGTSEIKGKTEFDFVLHNARVFCRMGESYIVFNIILSLFLRLPSSRPRFTEIMVFRSPILPCRPSSTTYNVPHILSCFTY